MAEAETGYTGDLIERLARISGQLERFAHTGEVSVSRKDSYTFTGVDDIADRLRPMFAHEGITITPVTMQVVEFTRDERDKGSYISIMWHAVILVTYDVHATQVPDGGVSVIQITTGGEGADTSDKALNKAQAAARKRVYIDSLHISTGDPDPDAVRVGDEGAEKPQQRRGNGGQQRQQQAAAEKAPSKDAIELARQQYNQMDADAVDDWLTEKGASLDLRNSTVEFLQAGEGEWTNPPPMNAGALKDLNAWMKAQLAEDTSGELPSDEGAK